MDLVLENVAIGVNLTRCHSSHIRRPSSRDRAGPVGKLRQAMSSARDARKDATVSILEVTGSALTRQEIINREMNWQIKLGWRAKRLDEE
jgi:hypothetical protein